MKVSDYIANLLVENDISNIFTVVGGGAMHLNDSFGNHPKLECIYNHHEQASAIAAESYARLNNKMAVACVTTGPGGTNAITGVLCAWQDNIPMLVISGQVRYETTVESTGLNLRQFGEQEHYIIKTVKDITKYSKMVQKASDIRYVIEKAIYTATHGRRGPCWIDVPLDIQGAEVELNELISFNPPDLKEPEFDIELLKKILSEAKRPVILAGYGLRTSGAHKSFVEFVNKMNIPVVVSTSNADILAYDNENYFGNFGILGGRCGNFIVQNADCLLVLGCRLSLKQIGFNYKLFSPKSRKIVVDIESEELKKSTISIDYPLCVDYNDFFRIVMDEELYCDNMDERWLKYCKEIQKQFPNYKSAQSISENINQYFFANTLKKYIKEDEIIVIGNNTASVALLQCGIDSSKQRLWGNANCGTMGYDLPAAIGASIASKNRVLCITGDGSIQMNVQELQTIFSNNIPIKIFAFNNRGYKAMVNTQTNFFGRLSGCTKNSGLTFPVFEKLAAAYDIPFIRCENHEDLLEKLPAFLEQDSNGICELIEDQNQGIEPRLKSRMGKNGQMLSPVLDDMAPFLDRETYLYYSKYFS